MMIPSSTHKVTMNVTSVTDRDTGLETVDMTVVVVVEEEEVVVVEIVVGDVEEEDTGHPLLADVEDLDLDPGHVVPEADPGVGGEGVEVGAMTDLANAEDLDLAAEVKRGPKLVAQGADRNQLPSPGAGQRVQARVALVQRAKPPHILVLNRVLGARLRVPKKKWKSIAKRMMNLKMATHMNLLLKDLLAGHEVAVNLTELFLLFAFT